MSRLAAALAGLARQTGAPALEQFEDEGFVRFHNSLQRLRLVERRSAQEPMPPAIGRGRMDTAAFGRLGQADAVDHRLRLVEPAILLAQPGHPRPGRGVEGAPARLAAIPRQAVRPTPADNVIGAAMRAAEALDLALADRRQCVPLDPRLAPFALFGRQLPLGPSLGRRPQADIVRPTRKRPKLGERQRNLLIAQPPHPGKPVSELTRLHRLSLRYSQPQSPLPDINW